MSRPLRILIVDEAAEYQLDFCLRCLAAGHQVKWFSKQSDAKGPFVGKGMVERVKDFEPWMRWADFVLLADCNRYLTRMDQWRKDGVRIIGPSVEAAKWETDRKLGMKIFQDAGIELPPYREFKDYDSAIAYVKKTDTAYVSKPCGDVTDKSLTYVAPTPDALICMLERWKRLGKKMDNFILQEKVSGVEMGVGGWWGPRGFNRGWEENFETKKLMAGDLGPGTGEMGTTMRFVKRSKLADEVLKPVIPQLEKLGYVGNIDVNCIIGDDGQVWPLEFTMRPGVPAWNIQQALSVGDPAEWLYDLTQGIDSQDFLWDKIAVGMVMAISPFPNAGANREEIIDIPIYGIDEKNRDHIHPCMVMMGEAPVRIDGKIVTMPHWVTAAEYVLIATGVDDTVRAANRKANKVLEDIKKAMPADPFYRYDIGYRLKKQLPILQENGFAMGMEF